MGVWRTIQAPSGWIWWGGLTWRALGKSASPLPAPAIVPEVSVLSSFEDRISLLPGPQLHWLCTQTPMSFLQLWATGLSSQPSVPTDRGCSCIADQTPSPQSSSQAASTRWGHWNLHVGKLLSPPPPPPPPRAGLGHVAKPLLSWPHSPSHWCVPSLPLNFPTGGIE